jgi:tetratricopeptide (TPR) repeat protein
MASFHSDLALCWNDLGCLEDGARNNGIALRHFERAITEQQLAIAKKASDDTYKNHLCNHLDNLGEQYVDLGRPEDGLPHYQEALKIRRELSQTHPENRQYTLALVDSLITLGTIERHIGNDPAASQAFAEAKLELEQALKSEPGNVALELRFAVMLDNEAAVAADLRQMDKAKAWLEDAAERFRRITDHAATADELAVEREWRSEVLWDLGRILRDLKLAAEANRVDAERTKLWEKRPPDGLVALALKHTRRATLIGYGKTPVSAQAKAVRERDLDLAESELGLAIAGGFDDLDKLEFDPDADALVSRARLPLAPYYNPFFAPLRRPLDR